MDFDVLASGSSGNCYRLTPGHSADASLLIECGLPVAEIRRKLGFGFQTLSGVVVSHSHMDHAKAVKDLLGCAVDVYASAGTLDALGVGDHYRTHTLSEHTLTSVGPWRILPFATIHDAQEPLGFLIAHGEERWLYATDTAFIRYRFAGLTGVAIEANHSRDIMARAVEGGATDRELARRIRRSHMSIETAIAALKANDLSRVEAIHLLHLSNAHSNAEAFRTQVERATGRPTYIA